MLRRRKYLKVSSILSGTLNLHTFLKSLNGFNLFKCYSAQQWEWTKGPERLTVLEPCL